jgi:hypothetical protein
VDAQHLKRAVLPFVAEATGLIHVERDSFRVVTLLLSPSNPRYRSDLGSNVSDGPEESFPASA